MEEENSFDKIEALQGHLGYNFQDKRLIETALTHKSYINEQTDKCGNDNERLEFLGDAVLGLVISDFLFKKFPNDSEGTLSKLKGFIVSKSFLFDVAKKLELGKYLSLGKGEANSGGRHKRSLLVDSFEAIVASIYLDGGLKMAYDFIIRQMGKKILDLVANSYIPDYKTIFQEYTQTQFGCVPNYKVISENGENHDPEFEISLFIEDKCCGTGKGKSKRQAEQDAAHNALINLNINVTD